MVSLVDDPFGGLGFYVGSRYGRRALLFGRGGLQSVRRRKLLRVSNAFGSPMHLDHFNGFSSRYRDREECLRREAHDAFVGIVDADGGREAAASPGSVQTWL